jgi:hypothetical protein
MGGQLMNRQTSRNVGPMNVVVFHANTIVESYRPESGGDMVSETSGVTTATRCNTPEDIRHCYRSENIPEDGILLPYIVSLYREADQQ